MLVKPRSWTRVGVFLLGVILIGAFLGMVGYRAWLAGCQLRQDIWNATIPIHYSGDVANAFTQGRDVLADAHAEAKARGMDSPRLSLMQILPGIRRRYHDLYAEALNTANPDEANYGLDYPPGRLLVATLWAQQVHAQNPRINGWDPRHPEMAQFMLELNTGAGAEAAVAMFLLISVWIWRSPEPDETRATQHRPTARRYGWWAAFFAAIPSGSVAALTAGAALYLAIGRAYSVGSSPVLIVWVGMAILFLVLLAAVHQLPKVHRAWASGLLAALMLWFNPSMLTVAYVWPQWDVWPVPFFITAALLATVDAWFLAGLVLAAGAVFKAQMLLAAPVLMLWPLFGGRFGALARIAGGAAIGSIVLFWPLLGLGEEPNAIAWLKRVAWCAGAVGMIVLLVPSLTRLLRRKFQAMTTPSADSAGMTASPVPFTPTPDLPVAVGGEGVAVEATNANHRRVLRRSGEDAASTGVGQPPAAVRLLVVAGIVVAMTAIALLIVPGFPRGAWSSNGPRPWQTPVLAALLLAIVAAPWFLRRRWLLTWYFSILGIAGWMAAFDFGADFSWYQVGFVYGTRKFPNMQMGIGSYSNLAAILGTRFGWQIHDAATSIALPVLGTISVDLRAVLVTSYFSCLAVCGLAASVHARRRSPRLLLALAAPWVLFPMLLTQMSERYLVMASSVAMLAVGASVGLSLLVVVLSLGGAAMTLHQLMATFSARPNFIPVITPMIGRSNPDMGWLLVMLAAVFLCGAVIPLPRRRRTNRPLKVDRPVTSLPAASQSEALSPMMVSLAEA